MFELAPHDSRQSRYSGKDSNHAGREHLEWNALDAGPVLENHVAILLPAGRNREAAIPDDNKRNETLTGGTVLQQDVRQSQMRSIAATNPNENEECEWT